MLLLQHVSDIMVFPSDHGYCLDANEENVAAAPLAPGYRTNIDNLDCEIRVRNMTMDHQNKSKHYVQVNIFLLHTHDTGILCINCFIVAFLCILQHYYEAIFVNLNFLSSDNILKIPCYFSTEELDNKLSLPDYSMYRLRIFCPYKSCIICDMYISCLC